ncbi:MAG: energy-coupling factor transporter ATPase [Clostridia bacterium]|nr:energy-coupling factor transporter ATPase [Clostridia bacterium]MDD4570997.1 energy-coupling factor transporter ATPase [Clostridia bacterium]
MPLKLDKVFYTYSPSTPWAVDALNDVSLNITDGECVGLVGHTGSGKSTVAQIMCGLIKPDSGTVLIGDKLIETKTKLKAKEMARRVGMVFQYPEHQIFGETVEEEIGFGPKNLGWNEAKIQKAVKEILPEVGLDASFLKRSPALLSGGEKRKVVLAGVLIMEPPILILDEPFVGLDKSGREDILAALLKWQQEKDRILVCISHDMDQLALFTKRIIVMKKGSVMLDGPAEEVFTKTQALAEAGVEPPMATRLINELKACGYDLPQGIIDPQAAAEAILVYKRKRGGKGV